MEESTSKMVPNKTFILFSKKNAPETGKGLTYSFSEGALSKLSNSKTISPGIQLGQCSRDNQLILILNEMLLSLDPDLAQVTTHRQAEAMFDLLLIALRKKEGFAFDMTIFESSKQAFIDDFLETGFSSLAGFSEKLETWFSHLKEDSNRKLREI